MTSCMYDIIVHNDIKFIVHCAQKNVVIYYYRHENNKLLNNCSTNYYKFQYF